MYFIAFKPVQNINKKWGGFGRFFLEISSCNRHFDHAIKLFFHFPILNDFFCSRNRYRFLKFWSGVLHHQNFDLDLD